MGDTDGTTSTIHEAPARADQKAASRRLPRRIILVRHGESEGNVDESIYATIPNHKIKLTEKGKDEAKAAGRLISTVASIDVKPENGKVYFYVSPYVRTKETQKVIEAEFDEIQILGVREECRVREQDFANFQDAEKIAEYKKERDQYGRFFYRFPDGESAADVYDRVSGFLETLWRDIDMGRFPLGPSDDLSLIIVSHGLTIRIFLMRWFKWTTEEFDNLKNPKSAEIRIMELGRDEEYSLAYWHEDAQLEQWGLSPQMIADQKRPIDPEIGCQSMLYDQIKAESLIN